MRLFVTGGTGFIGSHLLRIASLEGHSITALRRSEETEPRTGIVASPKWITKDLNSLNAADFQNVDILIHLAACGVNQPATWEEMFRVNVMESIDAWLKAIESGVRHLVICGSCFEYGKSGEDYLNIPTSASLKPSNFYGASKAAASMAAMGIAYEHQVRISIVRPFQVYGTGEKEGRLWPSLQQAARNGEDFRMTEGTQIRDFIGVEEVSKNILDEALDETRKCGNVYVRNLGSGEPQTVLDFCIQWWETWNARGSLLPGSIKSNQNDVRRYVASLD